MAWSIDYVPAVPVSITPGTGVIGAVDSAALVSSGSGPAHSTTLTLGTAIALMLGQQAGVVAGMPAPTGTGYVQWFPGLRAMNALAQPDATLGDITTDVDSYLAACVANPTLQSICNGFSCYIPWTSIEGATQGVYSWTLLDGVYNYLQSQAASLGLPPPRFFPQITCYGNWGNVFSASAGSRCVPGYIYNGSTTTYGVPSDGGNGAGWGLVSYNSPSYAIYSASTTYALGANVYYSTTNASYTSTIAGNMGNTPGSSSAWSLIGTRYGFIAAALDNVNVSNAYAAVQIAMQQYMLANYPYADGLIDYTASEIYNYSNDPTAPNGYQGSNLTANWKARADAIRAAVPNLLYAQMIESTSTGQAQADMLGILADAARVGAGFSCTDVYWSGTATDPTAGQRWAGGQVQATGGTWSQTGLDIRPIAPMIPTVQPLDQIRTNAAATSTPSSAAQTQNILTQNCYALIHANIIPFSMISEAATPDGTIPAYSNKFFYDKSKSGTVGNGPCVTGILAAGATPYTLLPSSLYQAPLNFTANAASTTSIACTWLGQNGVSFQISVNGTVVATVTGASYTITGLTAGTSYSLSIAMINANSTTAGPASTATCSTLSATGAIPQNVQLLLQGQTQQNLAFYGTIIDNGLQPQSPNFSMPGWKSVANATAYNLYRAVIPVGSQVSGTPNYGSTPYVAGISSASAQATYQAYVTATATAPTGEGGSGVGAGAGNLPASYQTTVDCAYADNSATNSVNGVPGVTISGSTATPGDMWPATGYSYAVSAIVGGVESALSAPNYGDFVNNGIRVLHDNAFNYEPVWNSSNGGTNPNTGNSLMIEWNSGLSPYFNPFSGNGAKSWGLNVRQWNYFSFWIKAAQNDSNTLTVGAENAHDVPINPGVYLNFSDYSTPGGHLVAGVWTFVKWPFSVFLTDSVRGRQNSFYKFASFSVNGMTGVWYMDQLRFTTT